MNCTGAGPTWLAAMKSRTCLASGAVSVSAGQSEGGGGKGRVGEGVKFLLFLTCWVAAGGGGVLSLFSKNRAGSPFFFESSTAWAKLGSTFRSSLPGLVSTAVLANSSHFAGKPFFSSSRSLAVSYPQVTYGSPSASMKTIV